MEHADSAPTVVLSPHVDDAVLSVWSVVGDAGDAAVVNVFAGVPEDGPPPRWDRLAGATSRKAHMEARLDEDLAALALAGRTAAYLPFLDRHYRSDGPPGQDEVERAVEAVVPAASLLYAPAGIGTHEDHVLVRDAALDVAGDSGFRFGSMPSCRTRSAMAGPRGSPASRRGPTRRGWIGTCT